MGSEISRRRFLELAGLGGLAVVAAACTGSANPPPPPSGDATTISGIKRGAGTISMFQAQSELVAGTSLFTFGLATNDGQHIFSGGSPPLFVAPSQVATFLGPFPTTPYTMDAYKRYQDQSPVTQATSFYAAQVDIPRTGVWIFATEVEDGGRRFVGTAAMEAIARPTVAPLGSKAISTKTPVATSEAKLREICTREPPDPMHAISLDRALRSGRPTVVTFATPLLCQSKVCGPVVDEVLAVHDSFGEDRANFIHVEEFLPGPDLEPPPPTAANQSPAFKAWHLETEPWTFVIDDGGIIRTRFEGPVVAAQIETALRPLL
jgi:hypothetical protein